MSPRNCVSPNWTRPPPERSLPILLRDNFQQDDATFSACRWNSGDGHQNNLCLSHPRRQSRKPTRHHRMAPSPSRTLGPNLRRILVRRYLFSAIFPRQMPAKAPYKFFIISLFVFFPFLGQTLHSRRTSTAAPSLLLSQRAASTIIRAASARRELLLRPERCSSSSNRSVSCKRDINTTTYTRTDYIQRRHQDNYIHRKLAPK